MISYINGNYKVSIFPDGTRIKETDDSEFVSEFPDSMDVKITNYCDNPYCMKYCHEKSNPNGKAGDILKYLYLFNGYPKGIELAIGGGNPLSHPLLVEFLTQLKSLGFIVNLTINSYHLNRYKELIDYIISNSLCYGIGVSYHKEFLTDMVEFCNNHENSVVHFIAGLHEPIEILPFKKILILGYKTYGNGLIYNKTNQTTIEKNLRRWEYDLQKYFNGKVISFDNLSITQLRVKGYFTEKDWNTFYQGDDGQHTFYLDLVDGTSAKSSISKDRMILTKETTLKYLLNLYKNS